MAPFEVYLKYLALKNHFSKINYDYFKYCKKTRANIKTFYKRKDRFFFEKLSRQKKEDEIENYFVSNFISCPDSKSLWIGDIIKDGEKNYINWKRKIQSLTYIFSNESENILRDNNLKTLFDCSNSHPLILKTYLKDEISIETLVICNKIFHYTKKFDFLLQDPVWETISLKIKKYEPFLNIDIFHYKSILKAIVLGDK